MRMNVFYPFSGVRDIVLNILGRLKMDHRIRYLLIYAIKLSRMMLIYGEYTDYAYIDLLHYNIFN